MALDSGETLLHCISKGSSNIDKFREACKAPVYDPPTEEIKEYPNPSYEYLNPQQVKLKIRAGEYLFVTNKVTLSRTHQEIPPLS